MRAWLEINLDSIVANARALAARVAPASLLGVLKSNAYGHGLVPVGRALASAGILKFGLAVFTAEEGLALREAAVRDHSILVLGPVSKEEASPAAAASLTLPVLEAEDVTLFPRGAAVHVKVNTGVGRFGIAAASAHDVIERSRSAGLRVTGIYSHLANAEDLDEPFTLEQVARLRAVAGRDGLMTHIAASAAAIMWPDTRLDAVRCGIALYGHWPSEAVRHAPATSGLTLQRALRWFAPVVQTREVAAGEPVGYGCEYVPARPATIAVLPLGYADGLPRSAGNGKLSVTLLASGTRTPIVGRVCMNACMIDVTGVKPAVRRGDSVEIDVDDVALAAGTINYEILARLPASLERRYV